MIVNKKIWLLGVIPVVLLLVAMSGDPVEQNTQQASPTTAIKQVVETKPTIKEVVEETKNPYTPTKTQPIQPVVEIVTEKIPEQPKKTYTPRQPPKAPVETKSAIEIPEETTQLCHPSYSGCLKPDAYDYDCAGGSGNGPYYTGKVRVIGPDVFGLDRDKDGWGCE